MLRMRVPFPYSLFLQTPNFATFVKYCSCKNKASCSVNRTLKWNCRKFNPRMCSFVQFVLLCIFCCFSVCLVAFRGGRWLCLSVWSRLFLSLHSLSFRPTICTRKVRHLASFMRTFGSHQFAVQTLAFAFLLNDTARHTRRMRNAVSRCVDGADGPDDDSDDMGKRAQQY